MKSIQNRLIILLLIFIIIPYFLSVLLIYRQTKGNVERHELENSQEQILQASSDLEQYFDDIVNLPYTLYRNPDLFRVFEQGFDGDYYFNQLEINEGMRNFYLMRNEILQLRFFINEGKSSFTIYNAMLSARKRKPDLLQQASIQKLMSSEENFIMEPPHQIKNYNNTSIMPPSEQTLVLTVHHKVEDVLTKEFLGIISIDIHLDKNADLSSHFLRKNKEIVLLTDSDGYVIYASEEALIGKTIPDELLRRISPSTSGLKSAEGDIVLSRTLQGASRVINAKQENVLDVIAALTDGQGVDKVIETAGSEHTVKQTPYLVKRGGTIVLVGLAAKDIIDFDFMQIMFKEADIKSVFRYRNLYPAAIGAIADGKIDVKGIVTHEFNFEDTQKAFDFVIDNKEDVVKAVIRMG
ncbi:zinc-binding dehydrogenase [Paenibacillus borealis]|uniref:zinc-binding dehydrogenase n=1 Tax=Paenibacillus borealis TaxID=160799 RepID=UPI00063F0A88|nr:zinc-binding dehydrogenase [Paenibacillus borealis]